MFWWFDSDGGETSGEAAAGAAAERDAAETGEAARAESRGSSGGSAASSGRRTTRSPYITPEEVQDFVSRSDESWEDHVLRRWTRGEEAGGGDLPEYDLARRLICMDASLMRESRVGRTLMYLQQERQRSRGPRAPCFRGSAADVLVDFYDVFEPALLLSLKKAFGHRSDIAARNEDRPVPIVAAHQGNFFDAAVQMWAALPVWKKPVMSAALRELLATEDATGMQVILGMVKASVKHCNAAKVEVWSRMLLRIAPRGNLAVSGNSGAGGNVSEEATPSATSNPNGELAALRSSARRKLWEECFQFADDWKEKAFSTVFVEPTKMYYVACGEHELADNVEVHGASVYHAVVLSTLGVWCPRLPFLLDTPMAAVSFLDALDVSQVRALWSWENFGKSFRSVPECRQPRTRNGQVSNHWSNFLFNGRQPWQIANSAIDENGAPERRQKLKLYLQQFAWYFSVEFLVPRLVQHLLERDELRCALQVLLEELRDSARGTSVPEQAEHAEEEEDDVRYWLWDLEVMPAELRLGRAVRLLKHADVLRKDAREGIAAAAGHRSA